MFHTVAIKLNKETVCIHYTRHKHTFSSSGNNSDDDNRRSVYEFMLSELPLAFRHTNTMRTIEHLSFTWQVVRKWPQLIQLEVLFNCGCAHLSAAGISLLLSENIDGMGDSEREGDRKEWTKGK